LGDPLKDFVKYLKKLDEFRGQIVHHEIIERLEPSYKILSEPLPDLLTMALKRQRIMNLYTHQAEAIEAIRHGKDTAIVTPTSSGKTLTYNIPVFEAILKDPSKKAIYIFPLKALEQDQKKAIENLNLSSGGKFKIDVKIYDGDTPPSKRREIRERLPHILITNPDMIHLSLLAYHAHWSDLFRELKFVVVDELHTYRGVFGSHIVQVFRRLDRICRYYGSKPTYIASSATISNPGVFCYRLFGREFKIIEKSGAPRAGRHFIFVNPTGSPYSTSCDLFRECIRWGLKTIAFTKARKITELLYRWLVQEAPDIAKRVTSYRAGYLPEERRDIERRLFEGELDGVISTSALEMGIDIGGLDACILVGYPGTIFRTWQRGGRVGRGERDSIIFLVALPDALDQYFMRHPEDFFSRSYESAVVDPNNKKILKGHLVCASAEIPLSVKEDYLKVNEVLNAIKELQREGRLLQSAEGTEWFSAVSRPHREVDIRGIGEGFTIVEEGPRKVIIGEISGPRVFSECHPGAIYLHNAQQYLVTDLDLIKKDVIVRQIDVNYYTQAMMDKDTEILEHHRVRHYYRFRIHKGRLKVTEKVIGYEKRSVHSRDLLSIHPLDMPPQVFETIGIWLEIEDWIKEEIIRSGGNFMGGIHAIEHAIIALFPLFAICDRDDIGGISFQIHPQVRKASIFIYDGYADGVGLSEMAFDFMDEILNKVLNLIKDCPCESGCPSCIHSPKCGSGNRPLDKGSAQRILEILIEKEELKKENQVIRMGDGSLFWSFSSKKIKGEEIPTKGGKPGLLFFDIETQKSAEEVGGWQNCHKMRLAVGVIYDSREEQFFVYHEGEVEKLIKKLQEADLVIGFNLKRFDYQVLSGYGKMDLDRIHTFDILEDLYTRIGFRLSLAHLAEKTLGIRKVADGLQSIEWFRKGMIEKVIEYCKNDVLITRDLFEFGRKNSYIIFEHREGELVRLQVDWDIERIISNLKGKGNEIDYGLKD
jgi:DEAD/DEAH box helicase domain-containing protein